MSVNAEKASATANALEREVVITRVFDAPRELVFAAWTDPRHTAQWWGPAGWTNPVCEMDVRLGGAWRIVMRAPDGGEFPCAGVYHEIVSLERLVFTNDALDNNGNCLLKGLTTVTFSEEGGKTKLVLRTRAEGMVDYAARMLAGMEAGWTQSLERLGQHVLADRTIVAIREFNASRELVFDAWTDPQHISNWWGPRGFTTTVYVMEVRPGGLWRQTMHGPDGADYENEIVFTEVERPERLAYDHVSHPPHHTVVTFEKCAGRTRLTLHMLFDTPHEREWVVKVHGAIEGAKQTLERLAEFLGLS